MMYNYKCPYCGREVTASEGEYAVSRKVKGVTVKSYAHKSGIAASLPKNKKRKQEV